jgi:predicted  nucleic acid-binding Zn ribbon protein
MNDDLIVVGYDGTYRTQPTKSIMQVKKTKIKTHGILLAKKIPIHICKIPGTFTHIWYWITGRSIKEDSMFRCNECNSFWAFKNGFYGYRWLKYSSEHEEKKMQALWKEAGGDL